MRYGSMSLWTYPRELALAAALIATLPAAEAVAAEASGVATATVVRPLRAAAVADLDFGTVAVAMGQGGSVVVSPGTAGATYGGSARAACRAGPSCGAPHPARFMVEGEGGRDYRIAIPSGATALSDGGGGGLAVEALTVRSSSRPGSGGAGQLDSAGQDQFEVGGTIRIPPGTPPARYRATVEVVVTYG